MINAPRRIGPSRDLLPVTRLRRLGPSRASRRSTRLARAWLPLAALVLLAGGCLAPQPVQAAVQCTVTGGYTQANFGTGTTYTGTISYTCTNTSATSATFTACAALGTTRFGTAAQPELRESGGARVLINFNFYTDPGLTTPWTATTPLEATPLTLAGHATSPTQQLNYYGSIPSGQNSPAGTYTDRFTGTVLGFFTGGSCQQNGGGNTGYSNTLSVTASVAASCSVTATNAALGSHPDTTTNVTGSGTIGVDCPSGLAYNIGLAPSNGSTTGAGQMAGGATGNTDKVPYGLYQNTAHTTVWGNTATGGGTGQRGNGEGGTGNGGTQSYTVYVLVPSTHYRADSYSDTVTVTVFY